MRGPTGAVRGAVRKLRSHASAPPARLFPGGVRYTMTVRRLYLLAVALACGAPGAGAQEELRLSGLVPAGGRGAVSDGAGGALRFTLDNFGPARDARVVAFYPARPDVRFARDV